MTDVDKNSINVISFHQTPGQTVKQLNDIYYMQTTG